MTGRDGGADLHPAPGESPVVVLVRPQLADNIGAVARAMANGGLFHLRLVAPRDGWPQERAWATASGAGRILDAATVHATVAEAVGDCQRVFATCPRPRHVIIPVRTARAAAEDLREINGRGLRAAVLFGPERAGLDNEDMARADTLVRYPLNPAHMSLNLAQAVMVLAYSRLTDPTALLIGGAVMGFFVNGMLGGYGALMSELYPTAARATAQNVLFNIGRAVGGFGPVAVGAVAAAYGFETAIALLALLYLLDILAMWLLIPERRGAELA